MNRNDYNPELREGVRKEASIGVLELCSVARGVEVASACLWQANVDMHFAAPVQPGKYVMAFTGSVQDVVSAVRHGADVAAGDLVDQLVLEQLHEQVLPVLRRRGGHVNGELDAVGVVETTTVASTVAACDLALKTASVDLIDLRIANGLGGKSFFTLTGEVSDVRAAAAAGARQASERGLLAREVVIPRPHPDLAYHL